jgi:hypothetical protein
MLYQQKIGVSSAIDPFQDKSSYIDSTPLVLVPFSVPHCIATVNFPFKNQW